MRVALLLFVVLVAGCVGYGTGGGAQPSAGPALTVSDQTLTGDAVSVDRVVFDKPGYVVIHADSDGKPGAVIGHSELITGERTNLRVTVDAAQAGARVFVMLHYDDDGDGVYGFPDEDKPVLAEGKPLVKPVALAAAGGGGGAAATVSITAAGFSPNTLTVAVGTTVTWINEDSSPHWPASAVHPTHRVYPGSDIAKCGTAEEQNIFDACRGLAQGEVWSFTFNEIGTWSYHDHLSPGKTGTVIVQ